MTAFALYVASERTIPHPCHFEEARNGWLVLPLQYKEGLAFKLFGAWERWDACWYAKIATYGYAPDGSTAFFPLFPALERLVALGGPHVVVAGMAVNLVATTLALWGLYRLAAPSFGDAVARRAMLLLAIFPAALFLLAPFSEAVFLALGVWAIERARSGDRITAAVLAAAAGLARPVGGLLALPLLWLAWQTARSTPRWSDRIAAVVAALAAPATGLLYLLFSIRVVGESMLDAQAKWSGSPFHGPWETVGATLDWVRRTGDPLQALQLALLFVFAGLFLVGIRRLPLDLTLYGAPLLYLTWVRILPTPLTSTARQMVLIFPLFIVLGLLLEERRALWSWAILSLLLLGALANEFVVGNFVG